MATYYQHHHHQFLLPNYKILRAWVVSHSHFNSLTVPCTENTCLQASIKQPALQGWGKLTWSDDQFPWYKYPHQDEAQATKMMSLKMVLGRDAHLPFLGAVKAAPVHDWIHLVNNYGTENGPNLKWFYTMASREPGTWLLGVEASIHHHRYSQ